MLGRRIQVLGYRRTTRRERAECLQLVSRIARRRCLQPDGWHNDGRRALLSPAPLATAFDVAQSEPLTLARLAQWVGALPGKIETRAEALKRAGFSFKRNRLAL